MNAPLISILIPCRNAERWLRATLTSAQEQTWPNKEIIVVDDGSTDESFALAQNFFSKNLQVVRQEQRGASAARNRAYQCAKGEYIQYLDADDLLPVSKLERQMSALEQAESRALSFSSVLHFYDTPECGERRLRSAEVKPGRDLPRDFLMDLWGGDGPFDMVQTGQWLTPRALIEEAGPWNEALSVDDDGEFFTRVVLRASRVMPVPETCTFYRKFRHGGNLSAGHFPRSRMQAAQLKSRHLLAGGREAQVLIAVRKMISQQMMEAYPFAPKVVASGAEFLREHGLEFLESREGSPWFMRLRPWLGWKMTRWLQWHHSERSASKCATQNFSMS